MSIVRLNRDNSSAAVNLAVIIPEDVVESDVVSVAEFLEFVTHVSEEQTIFVEIHFQSTFQQTQNQPRSTHWYHALHSRHTAEC